MHPQSMCGLREETYFSFLLYTFFFVCALSKQYYLSRKNFLRDRNNFLKIHYERQSHSHGVIIGPPVILRRGVIESIQN